MDRGLGTGGGADLARPGTGGGADLGGPKEEGVGMGGVEVTRGLIGLTVPGEEERGMRQEEGEEGRESVEEGAFNIENAPEVERWFPLFFEGGSAGGAEGKEGFRGEAGGGE